MILREVKDDADFNEIKCVLLMLFLLFMTHFDADAADDYTSYDAEADADAAGDADADTSYDADADDELHLPARLNRF